MISGWPFSFGKHDAKRCSSLQGYWDQQNLKRKETKASEAVVILNI